MLYNSIPVIMHHHVAPTDNELNVFPDIFEDQLRVLGTQGWHTLSGDEFLYFIQHPRERPRKCVLITFDDGFADNYVHAFPLLKKYTMKAMLFVATDFIDDQEVSRDAFLARSHNEACALASTERRSEVMCTWKELREMEESGAVDVQSHGVSHRTYAFMKAGNYGDVREDLSEGKAILEQRLSKTVLHFAWPRGHYDREGITIALDVGYRALYTTERGANSAENLHMISRLPVKCKKGKWLASRLPVYSSTFLSRIYLKLRTG